MTRRTLSILLAVVCTASGCSALAKKPPTPADNYTSEQTAAIAAGPGERYYLLVFGSQETPKRAKYTHTWATVVKVTEYAVGAAPAIQEETISWLPSSRDIRPLSFMVEPGTNFGLHLTIQEVLSHKERVSLWGPYEVRPGFGFRFHIQKSFMESGRVGYQCIDNAGEAARTGDGCNCIHAITDMDPVFDRKQYPLTYFGNAASENIVRRLHERSVILCPEAEHGWLIPVLGLDQYPIERQTYRSRRMP
ncbi:MAG TPA: hypothetical protein VKS79_06225 [Gemmataceae bacterium]|nr:hypothetical protein [Gemmataceae bacterium]